MRRAGFAWEDFTEGGVSPTERGWTGRLSDQSEVLEGVGD